MRLKPIASTLSIVPGIAKDCGVHRPAIAYKSATQNDTTDVAASKIHPCKQHALPHDCLQPNGRNALVLEYRPLIKAIAARIQTHLSVRVDMGNLIQAGTLGLMDATNKFDATKRIAFSSYAKHRIKGAILDSLHKLDEVAHHAF
jgi:DNA-directed RNA polymerase sigma subunit (sigma70/sigma32)